MSRDLDLRLSAAFTIIIITITQPFTRLDATLNGPERTDTTRKIASNVTARRIYSTKKETLLSSQTREITTFSGKSAPA